MQRVLAESSTTATMMRRPTVRYACAALLVVTLGFAAAVGLTSMLRPAPAQPAGPAISMPPGAAWETSRYILNALLATALDADAVPLRWVDPRAALGCGPNTAVLVNRELLRDGTLVPDKPFELDWLTDGCRPFGADGPRLDGRVRMTVFREDWGWSAMIEPLGFRVTSARGEITLAGSCGASLPQEAAADDPALLTNEELPCR